MVDKNGEEEEPLDMRSLPRSGATPALLEDRVVSELRRRQLIGSRATSISLPKLAAVIAACFLFFVAGISYEKFFQRSSPESVAADKASAVSMSDSTFVLFLMEGSDYIQPVNDQQQQERITAYRNWAVKLREQGVPITGTKLRDEMKILGNVSTGNNQNGIAGYFLIDAESSGDAIAIAQKCPHLLYGGTIEVRRIHPV